MDSQMRLSDLVKPQPKQRQFLDILFSGIYKFILYGGAAGGGKSYILRWAAVLFLIKAYAQYGIRNCVVGLFCEDFPQLKKRQIAKIATEFPRWLGKIKDSKEFGLAFVLHARFGSGIIFLCNLDEPNKYDSVEFAAIFVDELTKNAEDRFDELRKRLRWPRIWGEPHFPCGGVCADRDGVLRPCTGMFVNEKGEAVQGPSHEREFIHPFCGGTNPGGVGHAWVKRYWIQKDYPPYLQKYAAQFAFIQSFAKDNAFNPESYYEELKSLPPLMAKAYAEGNWDLFVGQFFSEWRVELHIVDAFEIPSYWQRGWGGDWGFMAPFAGEAMCVSPNDDVFFYRELYVKEKPAHIIAGELRRLHDGEQFYAKVLDPSCFSKEPGRDYAEQLHKAGWACTRADNDRINGWQIIRQYLAWERDENEVLIRKPKVFVMRDRCPNLVRTLPSLVFDENKIEDCDTDGEDHAPDGMRYIMKTRPMLTKIPLPVLSHEYQEAALRAEMRAKQERER